MGSTLESVARRVIAVIEEETAGLAAGSAVDHGRMAARKAVLLLELTRAEGFAERKRLAAETLDLLARLKARLAENRALLATHIRAAAEIVAVLTELGRRAESDGTYSLPPGQGRQRP
jgi:hypothetical protein